MIFALLASFGPVCCGQPEPKIVASANDDDTAEKTQQLKERVRGLLDVTPSMLADGATMPSSTAALEAAYGSGDYDDMLVSFLEFFMDMKLNCDIDEINDKCSPTVHACTDPLDEVTQQKVPPLYDAALTMMKNQEPVLKLRIWKLVVDKLATRVGMENYAFRDWCILTLQK